eukprot:CAMPEP_0174849184 /NCGR_PEP_ID=MMETSP1114-20130205/13942_1 /TAXON_ID=312471 /ORGANISM="Neobodo designis, Strain CCAP 1951/1" /LENGTH=331 /DNA_ID=CAMNT_0016083497 /DNA_START=1 /DNA_END=995 /DNA_ORIENTATION=-
MAPAARTREAVLGLKRFQSRELVLSLSPKRGLRMENKMCRASRSEQCAVCQEATRIRGQLAKCLVEKVVQVVGVPCPRMLQAAEEKEESRSRSWALMACAVLLAHVPFSIGTSSLVSPGRGEESVALKGATCDGPVSKKVKGRRESDTHFSARRVEAGRKLPTNALPHQCVPQQIVRVQQKGEEARGGGRCPLTLKMQASKQKEARRSFIIVIAVMLSWFPQGSLRKESRSAYAFRPTNILAVECHVEHDDRTREEEVEEKESYRKQGRGEHARKQEEKQKVLLARRPSKPRIREKFAGAGACCRVCSEAPGDEKRERRARVERTSRRGEG